MKQKKLKKERKSIIFTKKLIAEQEKKIEQQKRLLETEKKIDEIKKMIESNSSTKVSQNLNMEINKKKNREFSNACTRTQSKNQT